MNKCRLCGSNGHKYMEAKLFNRDVAYYCCDRCELVYTEEPDWLEKAYAESISVLDTGILSRNIRLVNQLTIILSLIDDERDTLWDIFPFYWILRCKPYTERIMDYGGGYGIFVRMMRDRGFDCFWTDKYSKNLFAKGFESDNGKSYNVVTAFELLEHFVDLENEFRNLFNERGTNYFIFSTLDYGAKPPERNWWYYLFETGQHVCFYNQKTFEFIAKKYGLVYYRLTGELHIFSRKSIPIKRITKALKFSILSVLLSKIFYKSKTISDHNELKLKSY